MDAVVLGCHIHDTGIDIETVVRDDSLAGAVHRDFGSRRGIGDQQVVERLHAVVARGNVEFAAVDDDDSLVFDDQGVLAVDFGFVTLDAVALSRVERVFAAVNGDRTLALDGVVFRLDRYIGQVAEAQVVAGMNAVVVVAGHLECAVSLDGQVVLGVDRCTGGVEGSVSLCVGLGAGRSVFKRVACAIDKHQESLFGVAHINRSIACAGELQVVQVKIDVCGVARGSLHLHLVVARSTRELIVAAAGDA